MDRDSQRRESATMGAEMTLQSVADAKDGEASPVRGGEASRFEEGEASPFEEAEPSPFEALPFEASPFEWLIGDGSCSQIVTVANGFVDGWLWRRRRFLATVLRFVDDLQRFSSSVRDEWLRLRRRFATVCDGFGDCLRRLSMTVCNGFDIGDDSCLSATLPLHRRR
nr:hypothetical protein CFP56_65753 [Quercus suber]